MDRKSIKSRGMAAFRANYWRCVLAGGLSSYFSFGDSNSGSGESVAGEILDSFRALSSGVQLAVVLTIVGFVAGAGVVGLLLKIFLFNPLEAGCYRFFRVNAVTSKAGLEHLGDGFQDYGRTCLTLFLKDLYILLWSLLLIIPGIVKSYSYRLVPYLLKDEPELTASEVITRSREMMRGHKWEAFVLDLSFLGWLILGILTFGLLLIFWEMPYYQNAAAVFYLDIVNGEQ